MGYVNIILNKVSRKENFFLSKAPSVRLKWEGGRKRGEEREGEKNRDQGIWMPGGCLSNSCLPPGCSSTAAAASSTRPPRRPTGPPRRGGEAFAGSGPCRRASDPPGLPALDLQMSHPAWGKGGYGGGVCIRDPSAPHSPPPLRGGPAAPRARRELTVVLQPPAPRPLPPPFPLPLPAPSPTLLPLPALGPTLTPVPGPGPGPTLRAPPGAGPPPPAAARCRHRSPLRHGRCGRGELRGGVGGVGGGGKREKRERKEKKEKKKGKK